MLRRVVVSLAAAFASSALMGAARVAVTEVVLPTYAFGDRDPVPRPGSKTWPYCRYDGFSPTAVERTWRAVVLENGEARVTILPEVGGKIWGAVDTRTGEDFVYYNHVAKFRDIAMCGPWTSGGIEFNFGIVGHGPYTSLPVDWTTRENPDGSVSCFLGLTEMICRTTWQVEVRLGPSGARFETRTIWFNGSGVRTPYYQWMNAAFGVKGESPEFFFPGRAYVGHPGDAHPWPRDEKGRNLSAYANNAFGIESADGPSMDHKSYHVLNGDTRFFGIWWPRKAFGAYHVNETEAKYGRKIWIWGLSRAGAIWEDLLTDADGQYVELQSGRCFQQPAGDCWKTPFGYATFAPGCTDAFAETWGVARTRDELVRRMCAEVDADRPTAFPADFDWDGAYGLWVKAKAALYSGLRAGGVRKGIYREEAESLLRRSLAKDPCFSPSLVTLGGVLVDAGRRVEALALLDKALAVDAYDAEANYLEGLMAVEEGRTLRARDRLGLAAFSPAFRAGAQALIAATYLRDGDWGRAGAAADAACAADARNRDALWAKAVALRKAGRLDAAKRHVADALAMLPLCHALRFEGAKLGLVRDYRELVRNHAPAETFVEMAGLCERAGLRDEANELYAAADGSLVAAIRAAYMNRDASALARARRFPVAFAFPYRRETLPALEWAAAKGNAWTFDYLLALALAAKGRTAESDARLEACAERPDDAAFYIYRATRRNGDAARADLARAAQIADGWRVAEGLYHVYAAEGDWAGARTMLEGYLRRFPDSQVLKLHYARSLVKSGAAAEAVAFLEGIRYLPSEIGEKPHTLYQEAQVMLAEEALGRGDEKAAADCVRKALNVPETLGSGRPYSFAGVIAKWPEGVRRLAACLLVK